MDQVGSRGEPGVSELNPSPLDSLSGRLDRLSTTTTSRSSAPGLEFAEDRARRIRELRLLFNYTENTAPTLDASGTSLDIWKDAVVQMAFTSDAMLHSMLAMSAQHILHHDPSNDEARAASLEYLNLALPLHRRDVAELNRDTADLVALTGSILRLSHLVSLQARPIEPYTPPIQFLLSARGSLDVFRLAVDSGWVHDRPDSIIGKMIARAPWVRYRNLPALFTEANRQPLLHLLYRSPAHLVSEQWSQGIQSAYEDTLSYLGAIKLIKSPYTIDTPDSEDEQPPDPPFRRLILFPTMVPETFIQLVVEAKPRALVILGHYFAALAAFEHPWWISKTGLRETQGLLTLVEGLPWEFEIMTNLLKSLDGVVDDKN
jgi:hypothetical protein